MNSEIISIVVPCFNEEDVLKNFYYETSRIMKSVDEIDYELLFVDDGSTDNTLGIIKKLSQTDYHVQYISLSRNFGKESAMYAGLIYSDGDYTVIMDADLQHPPKYILQMYEIIKSKKCDMVASRRKERGKESKLRSIGGNLFYKLSNAVLGINMANNALDYRMFNKKAKNAVIKMSEYNRFSKGIFEWIGFRTHWIDVDIDERFAGKSKWSLKSLIAYSVEGCVAFSTVPLHISSFLGLAFCVIAFVMILVMIFEAVMYGVTKTGYSTIVCLILLVSGLQLFCIGILGEYLAKDYLENKNRPIFLVQCSSKKMVD